MAIDGNVNYLAKFGYLSSLIRGTGKTVPRAAQRAGPAGGTAGDQTGRQDPWARQEAMRRARERASPADEVRALTDPNLADLSLDDFPRLKKLREALFDAPSEVCTERARLVTEHYLANGFEKDAAGLELDPYLRQAAAFHAVMTKKRAIIRDDDLLAGTTTSKNVGVVIYPEFSGLTLWPELRTVGRRALNPYVISEEDVGILNDDSFPGSPTRPLT